MIEIPIFSTKSSDFTQLIDLEGILVTLRLKYNIRNESWFVSIDTDDGSVKDIRLSIDFPVLRQHKALFPNIAGDFFVEKINTNAVDNLKYDNLGTDYLFLYYTEEEMEEWYTDNGIY